jgi:CHAT domain-containing protein
LRTLLTRPQGPSAGDELHHLTGEVYQLLLEECITALQADAQRLIIVPDGLLGYIPFEVLQRRRDRASLGAMYKVRYAHSATYLAEQMHPSTRKAEKLFAGFVASSDAHATSNALAALPGALSEVKSIVRELKSGFSLFEKATVTDFKQHASEYTLLHLAMHSLLNDRNPMLSTLVFTPDSTDTDGQMTALELYGIALQAELAVLSACNTGVGELHRGEGLMSFSRAFAYAGVPSLVISLWKVPDKATEKLMTRFYAYLKEGLPKDEALQKARLDFIAHNPDMSHPYFWAGFVLNGNAHPVSFPASVQQYMIFLFSALAIVVLVVYRKKLAIILQRYFSRSA